MAGVGQYDDLRARDRSSDRPCEVDRDDDVVLAMDQEGRDGDLRDVCGGVFLVVRLEDACGGLRVGAEQDVARPTPYVVAVRLSYACVDEGSHRGRVVRAAAVDEGLHRILAPGRGAV